MFSSGENATVHDVHTHPDGRLWRERADLIRLEGSVWANDTDASLLFYKHRIGNLLFPLNTIQVTGAMMKAKTTALFSRKADIADGHDVYSMHTRKIGMEPKQSRCSCEICAHHREFHAQHHLPAVAKKKAHELSAFGVYVPYDDCTDYCRTQSGDIVFFEHDIDTRKIRSVIEQVPDTETQRRVLKLSDRYDELRDRKRLLSQ